MRLINIDTTFKKILDIEFNNPCDDEIKNDYYMIMDIALSVILDIGFMNNFYNTSLAEDLLYYNTRSKYLIRDMFRIPFFNTLLEKLDYDTATSRGSLFTDAEIALMRHIIKMCYKNNMDRYEQFVKIYTESYDQNKLNTDLQSKNAESIWDAKNFSLIKILHMIYDNIVYGKDYKSIEPTYISICNIDTIPIGHIFWIQHLNYDIDSSYTLEAIGIQQSFTTLLIASRIGIKYQISKKLFDHIINQPLYTNASYMFAHAWPAISETLVKFYDFMAVRLQFCLKTKTECEMKDIKDLRKSNPVDFHNFHDFVHFGDYIFTYKKINHISSPHSDHNL